MTVRWFGLFLAVSISSGAARAAPTIPDPEYLDQLPVGSEIIFEAAIDIPVQFASVEFAKAFELPQRNRLSVWVQCKLNLRKESNRVRRIAAGTRLEITQVRRRQFGPFAQHVDVALWTGKSSAVMGVTCGMSPFGYYPEGSRPYYPFVTVAAARATLAPAIRLQQAEPEIVR